MCQDATTFGIIFHLGCGKKYWGAQALQQLLNRAFTGIHSFSGCNNCWFRSYLEVFCNFLESLCARLHQIYPNKSWLLSWSWNLGEKKHSDVVLCEEAATVHFFIKGWLCGFVWAARERALKWVSWAKNTRLLKREHELSNPYTRIIKLRAQIIKQSRNY